MNEEFRNATRRELHTVVEVIDTMTGARCGRVVDLSSTGMQLAGSTPLTNDALYQWEFALPGGGLQRAVVCGVHVLWTSTPAPGEYTAGVRFIQIDRASREAIRQWCEMQVRSP